MLQICFGTLYRRPTPIEGNPTANGLTNLTEFQKLLIALIVACISNAGYAQRSSELSADFPDSHTLSVQDKVENLFDSGDYGRAFFIYRNELAPVGDKYAQYMVGFMYQTGLGIEEDSVSAAAWYRLAAGRGTREFVVVRDRFLHVLDPSERERSEVAYRELRLRYCDVAVLLSSIKRNLKELQTRTGSRVRGQSSPVTVIESRVGRYRSGADYYGSIREELEARVLLLKEVGGFDDMETDLERINIHELERRVLQHIEADES